MKDINATVIVDLQPNEEELFQNLQKDARWGVKKAEKEDLIIEQTQEENAWKEFYEIYKNEISERGVRYETLEHVKEHGQILFICKKDGKIIAGATIELDAGYNKAPKLSRNASIKEFLKFQPNNLLYWKSILWCKKNKYNIFDLGGWQINAINQEVGVNKFKERWGKVVYFKQNYPFIKALKRKVVRNSTFIRKLNKKLKKYS